MTHPEGFLRHLTSEDASAPPPALSKDTSTMAHFSGASFLQQRAKQNSLVGIIGVSVWTSANI
jgi:hypothetical protein